MDGRGIGGGGEAGKTLQREEREEREGLRPEAQQPRQRQRVNCKVLLLGARVGPGEQEAQGRFCVRLLVPGSQALGHVTRTQMLGQKSRGPCEGLQPAGMGPWLAGGAS